MSIEENTQYWNSLTELKNAHNKAGISSREPVLRTFFSTRLNTNQRILDLGIGVGVIYKLAKEFVNPTKYFGADISEVMLKHCKEYTNDEIPLILLNSTCLPFLENYFDVIICYSVFTHLNQIVGEALLTEMQRILKAGGKAYISIIESQASGGDYKVYLTHNSAEFQKNLEAKGLKIISKTTIPGEPQLLFEVEK